MTTSAPQRWRFFVTEAGGAVVKKELDALELGARAALTEAMKRRARGDGLPREDEPIQGRIRAVRVTYDGREYRALYASTAPHREILLAVRVLEKKSRQLPKQDIELADKRLREWEGRHRKI